MTARLRAALQELLEASLQHSPIEARDGSDEEVAAMVRLANAIDAVLSAAEAEEREG